MITFGRIAGGTPASVSAMTEYLLTVTASQEKSRDITEYYQHGLGPTGEVLAMDAKRLADNAAHFEAWLAGNVAPDFNRLAEYSVSSDGLLSPEAVRDKLLLDIDVALGAAQGGLTPQERALHGLPDPEPVPPYLRGISAEALVARGELVGSLWDAAWLAADYRADVIASRGSLPDGRGTAVVRPDLHPIVALGLGVDATRTLSPDQISGLLVGRMTTGEPVEGKKYSKERVIAVDPRTNERKWATPIGSYDFTASPSKSISVAYTFASDVEQAQIFNCHIEAAREAVAYIADEIGQARLGDGGEDGWEPGHVAWVEFTHYQTRPVSVSMVDGSLRVEEDKKSIADPDLHTHFVIPNAVFCDSGRVGSLDTAAIQGFLFEADGFYHARLGHKLRDAGFSVELDERTGSAKMPVIPQDISDLFSKRGKSGEALARKLATEAGEVWDQLDDKERARRTDWATKNSRERKNAKQDGAADLADWHQQAKDAGWNIPRSFQFVGPHLPELTEEQRIRKAYEIGLPWLADKLEHRSVVPHWDLRLAALRGLVETGCEGLPDIKVITTLMRREGVTQYGEQTGLVWGQESEKRYTSVTTALHERDETEFVRLARGASRDKSGSIPVGLLRQKMAESGLDFTSEHGKRQRQVIELMGHAGRLGVAVGTAGSGKTAMLTPLVAAWKEMGRDVHGASLAWRQTDDLVEAGIDKRNLKAFSVLMDTIQNGSVKLTENSVVCVDELGLLGTRQGLQLLRAREKHGFTVVALGDDKQCGPQPLDAKVLTPTGFRLMMDLSVGDVVLTPCGETSRILAIFPQGIEEVYRITFSDGRTTECGAGHLWRIWDDVNVYSKGSHATRTVINRGQRWSVEPLAEVLRWFDLGYVKARQAAVPLVDPCAIDLDGQLLPIPPHALGMILGDGHFAYGIVHYCTADAWLAERLAAQLPDYEVVPITGSTNEYSYRLRLRNVAAHVGLRRTHVGSGHSHPYSPLSIAIDSLGLRGARSHNKFIPEVYKTASATNRLDVLRGLLDTDGTVGEGGTYAVYYSVSARLALDVQEMARSLGAIATISSRLPGAETKGRRRCYYINISHPEIDRFFSLPRKVAQTKRFSKMLRLGITSIEAVGPKETQCISIDHHDHLYVTDDYIVTHNSIEAGAIIDLMRRALGAEQVPEILTTKRQQTDREQEIVKLLRNGEAATALDMKRADGTAELAYGGREGVIRRVAALYAERVQATGQAPTISAPTNSDAHQIGEQVRVERRKLGEIGPDIHLQKATDGDRDYTLRLAKGDRVRLFRSTRADMGEAVRKDGRRYRIERSIGRNGSVVEVVGANTQGVTLKSLDGRVGTVKWSDMPSKGGRTMLAYGYATTIHTSQGSTADEHIFALPSGSASVTGAAGYTASTRHRHVAYLISSEVAERIAVKESRPINDAHDITLDDKWANVAKNFVNQRKVDSALAMLEKVGQVHRGAVRAFHNAVRPTDPRHQNGPPHAGDLVHRLKLDRLMERVSQTVARVQQAFQHEHPGLSR